MAKLSNYQRDLINKLGWQGLDPRIARNAIDAIVFNHMSIAEERHGEEMTPEISTCWLLSLSSDQVFGFLGYDQDPNYLGSATESIFISLRREIEEYMRRGYTHQEAIDEWFK